MSNQRYRFKEISMDIIRDRFLVSPIVWNLEAGKTIAIFIDPKRAEAILRALPAPPNDPWRTCPMNELEVLAWLREQRRNKVSRVMLDPELSPGNSRCMEGYSLDLAELLDSGKTLQALRLWADCREAQCRES
jgi:hypothetical protein